MEYDSGRRTEPAPTCTRPSNALVNAPSAKFAPYLVFEFHDSCDSSHSWFLSRDWPCAARNAALLLGRLFSRP